MHGLAQRRPDSVAKQAEPGQSLSARQTQPGAPGQVPAVSGLLEPSLASAVASGTPLSAPLVSGVLATSAVSGGATSVSAPVSQPPAMPPTMPSANASQGADIPSFFIGFNS